VQPAHLVIDVWTHLDLGEVVVIGPRIILLIESVRPDIEILHRAEEQDLIDRHPQIVVFVHLHHLTPSNNPSTRVRGHRLLPCYEDAVRLRTAGRLSKKIRIFIVQPAHLVIDVWTHRNLSEVVVTDPRTILLVGSTRPVIEVLHRAEEQRLVDRHPQIVVFVHLHHLTPSNNPSTRVRGRGASVRYG